MPLVIAALDLDVVADGVETESSLDYIRAHGCTQAKATTLASR